ncbi:MAG: 16S rRNA (guanine(966)-N(2))-methyltransferase RsmD [Verrucomicrobia bacterium]|nr:16S rRNA (guanine(966)-N(2))-methyltransferase RsmD [Verrucomicrobiota bacterium]MBI3871102.1 16S rRNA (guanine(966)-N(2))-methyltransferase RsmD [Verrucomicrobiota bacterium]
MRIIGGMAAGRLLKVPQGYDVRPTPDLVRQAIFNSLGARIEGARVLDLFSGSGAIGLECLSRGASRVVSVEKAQRHAAMIRQNLEQSGLPAGCHELRVQDVLTLIHQLAAANTEAFDLIIADPPFGEKNVGKRSRSLSQRLLDDAYLPRILKSTGVFVLGHTRRDTLTFPENWLRVKEMKHGDSMMEFLNAPAISPPDGETSASPPTNGPPSPADDAPRDPADR